MDFKAKVYILQICFMVGLPISFILGFLVKGEVNYLGLGVSIFMLFYVPKYNPVFQDLLEKWKR